MLAYSTNLLIPILIIFNSLLSSNPSLGEMSVKMYFLKYATATKEETGAAFISFDTYYTMDSQASGQDKYDARLLVTYNSNEIVSQTYKEEYNNGQGAIRTFTGFDNLDVLANTTGFKSYTGSYTIKFQVRTQTNQSADDEIRFKMGVFKFYKR